MDIVNTDADDQYNQEEIALLIPPILEKKADLVIGDRQVEKLPHMTSFKKYGNMVGSFMIRLLTGTTVSDASSGFRALSSECARILTLFSAHTYTHEMIIDAHFKNLLIVQVPITFKQRAHGTSRLMSKGVIRHIFKSVATIIRTVLLYQAFTVFTFLGSIISLFGLIGIGRYLYLVFFLGQSEGHIQSLVLSSVLIGMGFNILILGFIADLISYNRRLIEEKNEVR